MASSNGKLNLPEAEPLSKDLSCCADTVSSDDTTSGSTNESDGLKKDVHQREVWARKIDFLLACVGFSVGLGNVWRFPFLCYRNGGGAFLIPYFLSVLLGGIPVFFLEVTIGQFMSEGGVGCWKIAPLFQGGKLDIQFGLRLHGGCVATTGRVYSSRAPIVTFVFFESLCGLRLDIFTQFCQFLSIMIFVLWMTGGYFFIILLGIGYACAIIVFLLNCEYNIILTWALYYLFSSFTSVLPWSHGNNEWNSEDCRRRYAPENTTTHNNGSFTNITTNINTTIATLVNNVTESNNLTSIKTSVCDPVTEFWERKVLQLSSGVDNPGNIKWDLALCLLLAWIIIYFCIWKGIKSSGKVMYFTATSPYVLMCVLLIRGVTLDGAMDGIKYYLLPDWERLADPQVWVDAGTQIFFSYSISLGTLTALGSYNRFNHNSFRDSMGFAAVNSFTSLLAGFVIFSVLGFMAKKQGVSVEDVAESGPGLAFIAYPEAVSQMPVAPLWSCLFFVMVLLLGLDSQFVGVEGFVTAVVDQYPHYLRRGRRREIFIGIICIICFFIGLSMVTKLFDYYSASRIVLVVAFFECIVVAYIYGIDRYYDNLEMMFGFRLPKCSKIIWMVISPIFTMGIFILGAISYSELEYKRKTITYVYPSWAIAIGWTLASISVIWIPIIMVKRIFDAEGTFKERFLSTITPQLRPKQIREGEDITKIHLVTFSNTEDYTNEEKNEELLPKFTNTPGSDEYYKDQTTASPLS